MQNVIPYICSGWCDGVKCAWLLYLTLQIGYTMEEADHVTDANRDLVMIQASSHHDSTASLAMQDLLPSAPKSRYLGSHSKSYCPL
jgi:hypothetical protein